MAYQDMTFNARNPLARYAHRSRLRRSVAYAKDLIPPGGRVVDFGCGTGDFLNAMRREAPHADLMGFDPYMRGSVEAFRRVTETRSIESESADLVTSFEVLEHLSDDDVRGFVQETRRILHPGGALLVSVPIEAGPTLLLKEANRLRPGSWKSGYDLGELLRASFLGVPAGRGENRLTTHKGFDFREMRAQLTSAFRLRKEATCPFTMLPWWLNSQAFFVLGKR